MSYIFLHVQENVENFSGSRREPAPTSYSTAPPSYTGYTGGLGVANQRYSALETTDNQVRAGARTACRLDIAGLSLGA